MADSLATGELPGPTHAQSHIVNALHLFENFMLTLAAGQLYPTRSEIAEAALIEALHDRHGLVAAPGSGLSFTASAVGYAAAVNSVGPYLSLVLALAGCADPPSTGVGPAELTDDGSDTGSQDSSSGDTPDTNTDTDTDTDTSTDTDTDTGPTTDTAIDNLKPEDAPDWVVIAVSGHCIPPGCEIAGINHEYLEGTGTAARFADALEAWGFSVELWSYADEFYNRDAQTAELLPGEGDPIFYGFLQLHEDLTMVRDEWVAEFDDPTRVLVLAHSHGVVWAHTAMLVLDDLPIEVAIDFDGKSLGWEDENIVLDFGDDWDTVIDDYNAQYGVSWPFDLGDAEAGWVIPGQGAQDVEDVLSDSIVHNLELQATPSLVMPFPDEDPNHHLDGSGDGVTLFVSNSQSHMEIDNADGQAVNWALAEFAQLVIP